MVYHIGVARGGRGDMPPKFLENIIILCFERHFSKQNSVIRLKSRILTSPKFFGPSQIFGLATPLVYHTENSNHLGQNIGMV